MKIRIILLVFVLVYTLPSSAQTYLLQQDLGIHGTMRYCKYNNGKVHTTNSTKLCPMSIKNRSQRFGHHTGFLIGHYNEGMTKICIYNVIGRKRKIRISEMSFCPYTHRF